MKLETAKQCLVDAGYRTKKEQRLGNNTGTQLILEGGAIVKVFDNGNYSCEGKRGEIVEALLDRAIAPKEAPPAT